VLVNRAYEQYRALAAVECALIVAVVARR